MIAQRPELDVTVSIVNTNNRDLLRGCLRTITRSVQRFSHEVIVVDNASDDGSFEMLGAEFPHVKVIRNDVRGGYGYSHNRAIAESRGRYVLILNEDMEMLTDAIDCMIRTADETKNLGAMGCKILNADLTLQHSCFKFPTLTQEAFEAVLPYTVIAPKAPIRSKMYWWDHDSARDVDIVLGCCILVPREVIETVGAFDPSFFVYSEEHDLCRRIRNSGRRVVYVPEARMIHFGGQTSKHMSLKMALVQVNSRIRYFYKHHGRVATGAFRSIVVIGAALRLTGWSLIYAMQSKRKAVARARLIEYWYSMKLALSWRD